MPPRSFSSRTRADRCCLGRPTWRRASLAGSARPPARPRLLTPTSSDCPSPQRSNTSCAYVPPIGHVNLHHRQHRRGNRPSTSRCFGSDGNGCSWHKRSGLPAHSLTILPQELDTGRPAPQGPPSFLRTDRAHPRSAAAGRAVRAGSAGVPARTRYLKPRARHRVRGVGRRGRCDSRTQAELRRAAPDGQFLEVPAQDVVDGARPWSRRVPGECDLVGKEPKPGHQPFGRRILLCCGLPNMRSLREGPRWSPSRSRTSCWETGVPDAVA